MIWIQFKKCLFEFYFKKPENEIARKKGYVAWSICFLFVNINFINKVLADDLMKTFFLSYEDIDLFCGYKSAIRKECDEIIKNHNAFMQWELSSLKKRRDELEHSVYKLNLENRDLKHAIETLSKMLGDK